MDEFYRLFTLSRKRQGLAPQSKKWFANLMECFGEALKSDRRKRRTNHRRHGHHPHKDTLTYKYGCSDARYNNLG